MLSDCTARAAGSGTTTLEVWGPWCAKRYLQSLIKGQFRFSGIRTNWRPSQCDSQANYLGLAKNLCNLPGSRYLPTFLDFPSTPRLNTTLCQSIYCVISFKVSYFIHQDNIYRHIRYCQDHSQAPPLAF